MLSDKSRVKILGILFLYAFVSSLLGIMLSGLMSPSFINNETLLSNIAVNTMRIQISILIDITACVAVVAMGVLLFNILKVQNRILALLGLSLFLIEASILAVSKISIFPLLQLSRDYLNSGYGYSHVYQIAANLLVIFHNSSYLVLQFFYSLGGIIFFYLFYKLQAIPHLLSSIGLLVFAILLSDAILTVLGYNPGIILKLPEALFEIFIGMWLIIKGINLRSCISLLSTTGLNNE